MRQLEPAGIFRLPKRWPPCPGDGFNVCERIWEWCARHQVMPDGHHSSSEIMSKSVCTERNRLAKYGKAIDFLELTATGQARGAQKALWSRAELASRLCACLMP